ncbi:hypothetical protein SAMD00019534_026500 [Acytostelium subglobosum LB1]|uniref:hypothetical protein n=1 Tax=Acytostelium subglobosum LB1 TaxID=1410327 RepID=UPI0006451F67|nr:hypothetical protein SAMD00019534_026500 [Acytostelium subglobosum LB1]GAM19475.1 hypothetical protein SAMD00019534_026500 [Acytostelium subglobosum LB1]|eukprot:XP_012757402.1 hypothetical protein SAMD00019534_026500 [Acytostelium subglobosum LB1]
MLANGVLPPSLRRLTLRNNNNTWPETLPASLTSLSFLVYSPLLRLGYLPPTLTELLLGRYALNELQPGALPDSLITLTLGDGFNHRLLPGTLPQSLRKLRFGSCFNIKITAGVLPASLKSLKFGHDFSERFDHGVLPASIIRLSFDQVYPVQLTEEVLPASLTKLTAPSGTLNLSCGMPQSLTHLKYVPLGPPLKQLTPANILRLTLGNEFDMALSVGQLSDSLTALSLGRRFHQVLVPHALPHSLLSLHLGFSFNHPIERWSLPQSLTQLTFGMKYNKPIMEQLLPDSITELTFGCMFTSLIAPCSLPKSLRDLYIHSDALAIFKTYFNKTLAVDPSRHTVHRLSIENFYNNLFIEILAIQSVLNYHLILDNRMVVCRKINEHTVAYVVRGLDGGPVTDITRHASEDNIRNLLERRTCRGWGFFPMPSPQSKHSIGVDKV